MEHNFILHDHLYIHAAGLVLPFSYAKECTQGLLIYVSFDCVNSRWSTRVVRVGEAQNIFKAHSQISKLGMWTICFHILKDYAFLGLFFLDILQLCSKVYFFLRQ